MCPTNPAFHYSSLPLHLMQLSAFLSKRWSESDPFFEKLMEFLKSGCFCWWSLNVAKHYIVELGNLSHIIHGVFIHFNSVHPRCSPWHWIVAGFSFENHTYKRIFLFLGPKRSDNPALRNWNSLRSPAKKQWDTLDWMTTIISSDRCEFIWKHHINIHHHKTSCKS